MSNLDEADPHFLGNLLRTLGSVQASRCQRTRGLVNSSMGLEGQHVTSCTSSSNAASQPLGNIWYRYMSLTSDRAAALQAQSTLAVLLHKSSDSSARKGKIYSHLELLAFILANNQSTSIWVGFSASFIIPSCEVCVMVKGIINVRSFKPNLDEWQVC